MKNRLGKILLAVAVQVTGAISKGFEIVAMSSTFLMLLIIIHPFGLPESEKPDFTLIGIALAALVGWYVFKRISWILYCEREDDDEFFPE